MVLDSGKFATFVRNFWRFGVIFFYLSEELQKPDNSEWIKELKKIDILSELPDHILNLIGTMSLWGMKFMTPKSTITFDFVVID